MTAHPTFTTRQLAARLSTAANIALEKGVTIAIEAPDGATYRVSPKAATMPLGHSEKEAAACDQAFLGNGQ